jgi:hypothetical protein
MPRDAARATDQTRSAYVKSALLATLRADGFDLPTPSAGERGRAVMFAPPDTIRVVRGKEVSGGPETPARFHWCVPGYGLSGVSRQPLSDACRKFIAKGADPEMAVGRFRVSRAEPDLLSTVGTAAALTASDPEKGTMHFKAFKTFDRAKVREGTA